MTGRTPEDLLEGLLQVPSVTGDEARAVAWLAQEARADGFRVEIDDVGNLILRAGRGPVHVLFVGHIDTVPGGPRPFRDGDRMWGRGAVDAKGCLVAAYCAARARLSDEGVRITFVAAVGEEGDSRGMRNLHIDDPPDLIINGEPSGCNGVTIGYKGILRGRFRATGRPVHAGHPEPNVLDRCVDWWSDVKRSLGAGTGFNDITPRMEALHRSMVDDEEHAEGRFQIRLPVGAEPDAILQRLSALGTPGQIRVTADEMLPAAMSDRRSPLVTLFRGAIRSQGHGTRLLQKTGTADFNHLAKRWPGVPLVAYGPGDSSLDHTPEEWLSITELQQAIDVWDAVLTAGPQVLACTPSH